MQTLKGVFLSPIRFLFKYKYTILMLFYFCLITLYPIGMTPRLIMVVGCASLVFLVNILAKTRYTLPLTIFFIFIIASNAYFSFIYSSYISIGLLGSLLETNSSEALSVMSNAILPGILVLAITSVLIIFSQKELRTSNLSRRVSLLVLFLYIICLTSLLFRRTLLTDLRDTYNDAPVYVMQIATNYYSPLFYGNIMTCVAYANEMYAFSQVANAERVMSQGIEWDENKLQAEKIFVVIGESSTRARYSLYGYNVPTTPFLDSLQIADSLSLNYYKGIAGATFTRSAVPMMLSTSTAHDAYLFYREKGVIDLAKEAGYEVVWISNQARMDLLSIVGNSVGDISAQADKSYFVRSDNPYVKDIDLLPIIDSYQIDNGKKQLFIIHLIGSHETYKHRTDAVDQLAIPNTEKSVSGDYNQTIHHTDRVLRHIYQIMKNYPSSYLIYAPDHGEEIGVGHGLSAITPNQVEIPLLSINNTNIAVDAIELKYASIIDSTLNNSSMMYIISEMMGYSISEDVVAKTVEEGEYVLHDGVIYKFREIAPKLED